MIEIGSHVEVQRGTYGGKYGFVREIGKHEGGLQYWEVEFIDDGTRVEIAENNLTLHD